MVIQIVLVKIVRVFYNTVRIEYKNTFTGSYPYPSVTVFADSADFLLAISLIEKMPEYVLRLLAYKIQLESSKKDQRIHIIQDENNKSIVLINDIRFKSRRNIDWNEIEEYLKEYIGNTYEILETCEKIYIGNDFPDEFCHSKDKIRLKGANEKAKAKKGWYRYDTRFGIPKYDENGELEGYHIYSAKMLVRRDEDGKLYLYDFVRTKKETSSPLRQ